MSTVVVVGSGGREHAIARALERSAHVKRLVLAPGNGGMPATYERWETRWDPSAQSGFVDRCAREGVSLVFIGPDQPLADGLADALGARGVLAFGPKKAAARIEWSKAFAKDVMRSAGVPTADSFVEESVAGALERLRRLDWGGGWVVKADGLALGKGVAVCASLEEAERAVAELGAGGHARFVIEERLRGQEISWMAFCDGRRARLWEPARDFKRAYDRDEGPNTGGMGALSPVPGVPPEWRERVRREVFEPTLAELARRGAEFRGILYAGLMVAPEALGDGASSGADIKVIEFNSRLGDPEAQVLLDRFDDDLYVWAAACAEGQADRVGQDGDGARGRDPKFRPQAAVIVVGAAPGYPGQPQKGAEIPRWPGGPEASRAESSLISAGVARSADGRFTVGGGRVLGALGRGETLEQARRAAYGALEQVRFEGMRARADIAWLEAAPPVAILASGRGSNFEALMQAIEERRLRARVTCLLTDQPEAGAIGKARARGLRVRVVPRNGRSREEHDRAVLEALADDPPRWLALAGYMRLLSPALLRAFADPRGFARVVNVHPSLLPAYKGLHAYRQAFEAGAPRAGVSVHLVTSELDSGPICAQAGFDIGDCGSAEEVERRGLELEHRLYPATLNWLLEEDFEIQKEGEVTRVLPN